MTRTVLVTGGTSGIGRAIAARFAADQAKVFITGRNPDTVEVAAKELGVHGVVCDASDTGQVAELAARLNDVDVLVNAAGGLSQPTGDVMTLEEVLALWHANLAQNLLTAVLTTASVQHKLTSGSAVVSIGSIGAERGGGSYGAAKAALSAWNASLSSALAPRGVTCNVISAGYIAGTNFFNGQLSDERHRALVEETHNKRPGTVDDIAQTAYFLASPGPGTSPARPSTSTEVPGSGDSRSEQSADVEGGTSRRRFRIFRAPDSQRRRRRVSFADGDRPDRHVGTA